MANGTEGADGWGITNGYHGTDGTWHETSDETRADLRRAMGATPDADGPSDLMPTWVVPEGWGEPLLGRCHLIVEDGRDEGVVERLSPDLPIGRHRLVPVDGGPTTLLIVRPRRCHRAPSRAAGLAVQLYAARSNRSWGIGDLRDLRELGGWAASNGIDVLGISPLHAPTPAEHPQPSPYYPSSRRHLNPLHICVEEVPGAGEDPEVLDLGSRARQLLAERRIDRSAVWAAKRRALWLLFERQAPRAGAVVDLVRDGSGDDLERWSTFCAIAEAHPGSWQEWPEELRHPDHPAVARFASDHADVVRFHSWLQWTASQQLAAAAGACPLISDLAVGVDPGGAEAWIDQDLLALGARVGAPPDDFSADGQDWGLPPYRPHALRAAAYEPFARDLRANLRHGAGIRIDHVLGLFRLFWVPEGASPAHGAYVRSDAEELLAVLAIESVRAGGFVVGEDLGTVGSGVHERLAANGVLGPKVVYFEEDPPAAWKPEVLATATTHDLPTIAGLWDGSDGRARAAAGLPAEDHSTSRARLERLTERDADPEQVVVDTHRALAASDACVVLGTLDDVLVVDERPNMPGTTDEWPNWSIALPVPTDELIGGPIPSTLRAIAERQPSTD